MEPDKETGKMKIRANQGHSIEVQDLELKPLLSTKEVSMVIHGTYYNSWEKIKNTGLSRMNRNHIHFAAGEPGENGVISGMRQSCEVMIFINLETALKDGFKFFRSANNVILCAGNEDGVIPPKYFVEAVQRNPRQRLEFDQNVKVVKVPIGGASLVQHDGKGKKKKNKKSKGDREKEEGTETQKKKDKTEIDETAVEDTAHMFNEKMEVDSPSGSKAVDVPRKSEAQVAVSGSGALGKLKDDYPDTPNSWEDDDKFEDAVQHQEEEFVDAHGSGPDVIVESKEEVITIDENENSLSAIDYLMEKDMVAVHVEASEDGLQRITCVTEDKSYIFDVENNPDLMTFGKVAEFFNWTPEPKGPTKVFHGLDSKTCAVFFDKYEIILDGTKIYDLKIAYDKMKEGGLGDLTKLQKTGFRPDCIPVDTDNVTAVCWTYIKAYQYFSKEVSKNMKDYKKYLFEMVKADIDVEKMKKLREKKKKDLKAAANQVQNTAQAQQKKSKRPKHK
ncbi:2'-phosphotransferase [Mytilus galloprovincialis]|uniref:2'-phosphotransferase n=1 Tax=Mytilus galloprovincialis TaxID=29158 RepID=A0A8B6BXR1_MYTGA|nr:2'-phosphotransferase [Mytilus galloprovincialis]